MDKSTYLKYIFLDFDGVITTPDSGFRLHPEKCALVQEIIDRTGAEIIVTSSWRRSHTVESFKEKLSRPDKRYIPFVVSWIDRIAGLTVEAMSVTPGIHIPRGTEIMHYMDNYIQDQFSYVILDDDADMLLCQSDNFIHINPRTGLTMEDVDKAVEILNNFLK